MQRTDGRPGDLVADLARAYLAPRCLHVVAEIGVADHLADVPRPLHALAEATAVNPDALGRILDLLATQGVFARSGSGYEHTPASRLLLSDHPQSLRSFVRMMGSDVFWSGLGDLAHSLETGAPAVTQVSPEGLFAYLRATPEMGKVFDEAMTGKSRLDIAGIIAAYDFSRLGTVADVGGGRGHLLQAVLEAAPRANGILFDLPQVVANSKSLGSPRMSLQAGDFFKDPLPLADAYLLCNVVHDWSDDQATAILLNVRRAVPKGGRLLVIENILPEGPEAHRARQLDIIMLAMTGGRERTNDEYERLLAAAGFQVSRVVRTQTPISIIEAVPADRR
jgi:hypothetical protein